MSKTLPIAWTTRATATTSHRVVDGAGVWCAEARGLTLQQVADAYLTDYELPDDDKSPVRFTVETADGSASVAFSGRPNEQAIPAPRRGRPPVAPHMARVQVAIRLPHWLVEWIDAQPDADRTSIIETAIVKHHKLKAPKS